MVSETEKQLSTYPPEVLIFISSSLPSPPAPSLTHRAPWVCFPNNPTIIRLSRTWLLSGRTYSFLGSWLIGLPRYRTVSHWNEMLFSHHYFKHIKLKSFYLFYHCAFLTASVADVSRGSWVDGKSNDSENYSGGDQTLNRKQCRAHRRPSASFQERNRARVWEETVPPVAASRCFSRRKWLLGTS